MKAGPSLPTPITLHPYYLSCIHSPVDSFCVQTVCDELYFCSGSLAKESFMVFKCFVNVSELSMLKLYCKKNIYINVRKVQEVVCSLYLNLVVYVVGLLGKLANKVR